MKKVGETPDKKVLVAMSRHDVARILQGQSRYNKLDESVKKAFENGDNLDVDKRYHQLNFLSKRTKDLKEIDDRFEGVQSEIKDLLNLIEPIKDQTEDDAN